MIFLIEFNIPSICKFDAFKSCNLDPYLKTKSSSTPIENICCLNKLLDIDDCKKEPIPDL